MSIPMPNVLTLLPARARQAVYVGFGSLVIAHGTAEHVYAELSRPIPEVLVALGAALAYLTVPVLALAAVHVAKGPDEALEDAKAEWRASYGQPELRAGATAKLPSTSVTERA